MKKMVWSDSLGELVIASFTYKKHRYEWNDVDCVYYDETEGDESFLMDVPKSAIIDEEEKTMTREEKLFSMTMKVLAGEAEKLGVKINKKGKKEDAVKRILDAEAAIAEPEEKIDLDDEAQTQYLDLEAEKATYTPAEEVTEAPETEEPAPKKERKTRTKKTFESLLAVIPVVIPNVSITPNGKKRNAVHLRNARGTKRIFGYDGAVIVVNNEKYLHGVVEVAAEKRNYGYRVEPTAANMIAIQRNYAATLA
jgi:hypothetical protein